MSPSEHRYMLKAPLIPGPEGAVDTSGPGIQMTGALIMLTSDYTYFRTIILTHFRLTECCNFVHNSTVYTTYTSESDLDWTSRTAHIAFVALLRNYDQDTDRNCIKLPKYNGFVQKLDSFC